MNTPKPAQSFEQVFDEGMAKAHAEFLRGMAAGIEMQSKPRPAARGRSSKNRDRKGAAAQNAAPSPDQHASK
jgi:hypothetical protein